MNIKQSGMALSALLLVAMLFSACVGQVTPTVKAPAEDKPATSPTTQEQTQAPAVAEKVTLSVMTNWTEEDSKGGSLKKIIEDFQIANQNITIDLEYVPSDKDIPTKVETAFMAGKEPDLILHNYIGPSRDWVEDGVTIAVTDLYKQWGFEGKFREGPLAEYTDEGVLEAFPLEGFTWPIWFNMKIFKEVGIEKVPTTSEELLTAVSKIHSAGYTPFATGGADWTGCRAWQLQLESDMEWSDISNLMWNGGWSESATFSKALDSFLALRDAGFYAENVEGHDAAAMLEMFFSGKAAMMHAGSWSYADLPKEMYGDVVLGGFPVPAGGPNDKPVMIAGFDAKGVHISRNGAKKLDSVEKFVKFLYQPEMIARFVEEAAMMPPLKDVPVDESKLNPLFVQSLKVDAMTIPSFGALVPAPIFGPAGEFNVCKLAYIPSTTKEEILKAYDDLYAQLPD